MAKTASVALTAFVCRWPDIFLPPAMLADQDARRAGRSFVTSHAIGPLFGFAMLLWLYRLDPGSGRQLLAPMTCMAGFWLLLPGMRLTGRVALLSLLSVQNLAFIVLYLSWCYGGIHSPFLPWIVVTPLFTFLYLGEMPLLSWLTLGALAAEFGLFLSISGFSGAAVHLPPERLASINVLSLFCAGTALAAHFAHEIASKSVLEHEVEHHLATERALAEARDAAEAASRSKTDFLASMSHELRTPLNAVIGFSEMMASETLGPIGHERYRGYAKDIHDSGSHLLAIINDILDVAKAESGTFELFEEIFDCREAITEAAMMLRQRISEAGLRVELELPPGVMRLRADRRRIKQVFLNLIHNAVKFTPSGGKIRIHADCNVQSGLAVTVEDTGIGIAPENLKKVLQPFFQVRSSARYAQEGAGLGLPLVQAMMKLHGGRFELDSEPGLSTTARVIFPPERLVQDGKLPGVPAADPDPAAIQNDCNGQKRVPTILVVDDNENHRVMIARMLTRGGYRALTAAHGREALNCAQTDVIDVIVTDLLMPEMDGTALLQALDREQPGVPVIAVSGVEGSREWLRSAEHLGAFETLQKPVFARQLLQVVEQALNRIPADALV
ncbi:MAG TPA: ATP-binding protein [Micropepsaceae bacterium]|nr:ATP-binding protein [Micropepsaceae bacterium]